MVQGEELIYPGSPTIVRHLLRPQDRMVLCELHSDDYHALKRVFARETQVAVHHQDGYLGLKSFLPPKEKRGLILIDPPYEKPNEFDQLIKDITMAVNRFATGVYAIWYPLKNRAAEERFLTNLKDKIDRPVLCAQMSIYSESLAINLNGTGMAIINPPWQLDQELQAIMPWLWRTLSIEGQGSYKIKML
jgi:23S rRNA (adenine2030-N6)-methyltransferase